MSRRNGGEEVKPLNVRVAEALGCKPSEHPYHSDPTRTWWSCGCRDRRHHNYSDGRSEGILMEYDTDWSATGPLILKYGIELEWRKANGERVWSAGYGWQVGRLPPVLIEREAATPLLAVCDLILALKEAGMLRETMKEEGWGG